MDLLIVAEADRPPAPRAPADRLYDARGIEPADSSRHSNEKVKAVMRMHRCSSPAAAVVAVCGVLLAPVAPLVHAQAPAPPPAPAPATAPATAPAQAAQPDDGGWPRDFATSKGGALRIFQPQVASWDGQKKIVMYAAVSHTAVGAQKPELGTVKIEADTSVAVDQRLVNFSNLKMTESNFPGVKPELQKEIVSDIQDQIQKAVPEGELVLGLDRVLARLDKSQLIPKNVDGVKADPPVIFYSAGPAVLVNLDGDPIWSPIKDNDLKFALNTNWDLFQLAPTNTYYLRYNESWLTATDIKGAWIPVSKLPDAFKNLPADDNWKDVKEAVPGKSLKSSEVPKVFVSTTPAEMILVQGQPKYVPVMGTGRQGVR